MKVAIFGAGSTGCYLGGLLTLAGFGTTLICRERIKNSIKQAKGLTLTDFEGQHEHVMPNALITEIGDEQFDLVFVMLKCHQLASIKPELSKLNEQGARLVFMQNGIGSLEAVRDSVSPENTLQGITPFNVLSKDGAVFHRGTEGKFVFQLSSETTAIAKKLKTIGFECELYEDMRPAIYGKLLLNLNNAINAIVDLPLKTQLENRQLRKILSKAQEEWLAVSASQGVEMIQYTAIKPKLVPKSLLLPNFIFKVLASKMIAIDPEARSSMWEDIQLERKTEIEFLNGAVANLGKELGVATPVNQKILELIHQKESKKAVTVDMLLDVVA